MFSILQSPVFLLNSRFFHFLVTYKSFLSNFYGSSLFRSYRVNLQSSFKILFSIALVFSTSLPVSVFSTVHNSHFPIETLPLNLFFILLIWYYIQSCCAYHSSIYQNYFWINSTIEFSFQNFILRNRLILHNFNFFVENLRLLAITIF